VTRALLGSSAFGMPSASAGFVVNAELIEPLKHLRIGEPELFGISRQVLHANSLDDLIQPQARKHGEAGVSASPAILFLLNQSHLLFFVWKSWAK
jgi:hypothetical protein